MIIYIVIISTLMYLIIKEKSHMRWKILLIDNFLVILICILLLLALKTDQIIFLLLIEGAVVLLTGFVITMWRFWRTPNRKVIASDNEIVSPADGKVIYINKITEADEFISIKKGKISDLYEITQTELIKKPCLQIGINMTPFDVHKNCSPIKGNIVLSKHIQGVFHSLKAFLSMTENERHTFIVKNDTISVGVVLIASKRVKRIDSYVKEKQQVDKGDWIGMIRFGSQVDVFLPIDCDIKINLGDQIFAKKTIIAKR